MGNKCILPNVLLWAFNRGCPEENSVPAPSMWGLLFSKVFSSQTTAAVCWRSHCGQTLQMLNFLGSVIPNHMKRRREYYIVLLKEDLKACVQGRDMYTLIPKWQMTSWTRKGRWDGIIAATSAWHHRQWNEARSRRLPHLIKIRQKTKFLLFLFMVESCVSYVSTHIG